MDIAIKQDITTFESFSHHHFGRAVLWALLHTWSNPLTIQIKCTERTPIIADNDTIWIEHWYDLEDEVVT